MYPTFQRANVMANVVARQKCFVCRRAKLLSTLLLLASKPRTNPNQVDDLVPMLLAAVPNTYIIIMLRRTSIRLCARHLSSSSLYYSLRVSCLHLLMYCSSSSKVTLLFLLHSNSRCLLFLSRER